MTLAHKLGLKMVANKATSTWVACCGCKSGTCKNRRCACVKAGRSCGSGCLPALLDKCKNQAPPTATAATATVAMCLLDVQSTSGDALTAFPISADAQSSQSRGP